MPWWRMRKPHYSLSRIINANAFLPSLRRSRRPTWEGSNWNRIQALIAVATGGVSGRTWGRNASKARIFTTAVAHNDFICGDCGRSGLLGGGLAIGMLCLVVFGCLRVAVRQQTDSVHACRWGFRSVDDSHIHQYWNDHWNHTNHWVTPAF